MKLSITTLALAAGFAAAAEVFDPPIPFIQYDGDCSGDVLYNGVIVSIAKLEEGSFCVADIFKDEETGEEETTYSRVDILQCEEDKIYEDWHYCDEDCVTCDAAYQAYTSWESTEPGGNVVGFCFDYHFSLDDINVASTRSFRDTKQINYAFAPDAKTEDVEAYLNMMDNHSCIAAGKPGAEISEDTETEETVPDDVSEDDADTDADTDADADADTDADTDTDVDAGDSGASTLAATAAVAMAAATTMLLA